MKYYFLFILILLTPTWMLAQKAPTWQYDISWKVSELAQKEIAIDYSFLKTGRQIFGISTGYRWHSLEASLQYQGTKTNFFIATNKYHHNYIKSKDSKIDIYSTVLETAYFNDTKSLTRLGAFAPKFSIPVGFSYLRKFGPDLRKIQFWVKMESILFFHSGYQYSSEATELRSYGYSPETGALISKYQETVIAKKTVETNVDFTLGIMTRMRIFEDYFIGLNSKVQFMPKRRYNPSSYHGLQRISSRFVISFGKYLKI